jgi:MFS superfamily sulfate permease-like transporter
MIASLLFLASSTAAAPASPSGAGGKLTVWEKIQAVPTGTWVDLGITVIVIVGLIFLWRSLKKINDIVPWVVFVTLGGTVIMYWTYERKEPKILAPIFDQLAKVLPSKIQYRDFEAPK